MATISAPSFESATEVLEAIVKGGSALFDLKAFLSTHDVQDYRFEVEAWVGVCGGNHSEAEMCAYNARMAVVDAYGETLHEAHLPLWADRMLPELLTGSGHRTSYAAFGDEYIAAMIKLALPPSTTVSVPRHLPAYKQAAQVFSETVNEIVRPLLKTSLKQKLIDADWDSGGDFDLLVAAVVTMREIIRAPELFIDSDAAAANPAIPCIFIRRALAGGSQAAAGVLYRNTFTVVQRPIDSIAAWLVMMQDVNRDLVGGIIDALESTDTRSSTAKSIVVGRNAFARAKAEAMENAVT